MRVDGTLYFILKGRLGSASTITDMNGNVIGENRYYPYRETRYSTGSMYTDKLFTGQREVTGLGIYHYGARFYSQKLGRFLSADTVVPGVSNPQALSRYSYVLGNPLKYTDPSGHLSCNHSNVADGDCTNLSLGEHYGITFAGSWTHKAKQAVFAAVHKVGKAFANEIGGGSAEAFRTVYGAVHFQWGNCQACGGSGGYSYGFQENQGYHLIAFESITGIRFDDTIERGVKHVVHELGHIYNQIQGRGPSADLDNNRSDLRINRGLFLRPNEPPNRWDWQQHPPEMDEAGWSGTETFADMFIAWTYDAWNTSPNIENVLAVDNAQAWMNQWIP